MDNLKEIFGIASVVFVFVGLAPYMWGMYRRTAKPHMFSWLIWGVLSGIVGYIQFVENAGIGSAMLLAAAAASMGIAITSYWLGTKDIRRSDWVVLFVALSSIPLWILTKNPLWSVLLVVGIDAIGYIPTIRKSWHKPYEEPVFTWAISIVTFSLSILALESYSLTTYLYPAVFIAVNLFLVVYLLLRRQTVG